MVEGCLLGGYFLLTGGVSKCRWEVGGGLKKFLGGFSLLNFYFSVYFNHFLTFCVSLASLLSQNLASFKNFVYICFKSV